MVDGLVARAIFTTSASRPRPAGVNSYRLRVDVELAFGPDQFHARARQARRQRRLERRRPFPGIFQQTLIVSGAVRPSL